MAEYHHRSDCSIYSLGHREKNPADFGRVRFCDCDCGSCPDRQSAAQKNGIRENKSPCTK